MPPRISRPKPGREKTISIAIESPDHDDGVEAEEGHDRDQGVAQDVLVEDTRLRDRPFARAVRTKSSRISSSTTERVSRVR